jgi:hypothetical protein
MASGLAFVLPLHIKLSLMKNSVKSLSKISDGLNHLREVAEIK